MVSRYVIGLAIPYRTLSVHMSLYEQMLRPHQTAWTHWRDHWAVRETRASTITIHQSTQRANIIYSYKLVALKLVTPSKEHMEKHYEDLAQKPFYKGLVTCRPWEAKDL